MQQLNVKSKLIRLWSKLVLWHVRNMAEIYLEYRYEVAMKTKDGPVAGACFIAWKDIDAQKKMKQVQKRLNKLMKQHGNKESPVTAK